jgi:hypothetical protein
LCQAPKSDRQAFDTKGIVTTYNTMEKPNVRGPSPSRKAHFALGDKLNRKDKLPPRMPVRARKNRAPSRREIRRLSGKT